jgi:hypothetical protein
VANHMALSYKHEIGRNKYVSDSFHIHKHMVRCVILTINVRYDTFRNRIWNDLAELEVQRQQ